MEIKITYLDGTTTTFYNIKKEEYKMEREGNILILKYSNGMEEYIGIDLVAKIEILNQ